MTTVCQCCLLREHLRSTGGGLNMDRCGRGGGGYSKGWVRGQLDLSVYCVVLLAVMVTCDYVSMMLCIQIWAEVHRHTGQKSTILHSRLRERGMPISFHLSIFSYHLLLFIVPLHSYSLYPPICPISPVMAESGTDKGTGCCGKGSQVAVGRDRQPE